MNSFARILRAGRSVVALGAASAAALTIISGAARADTFEPNNEPEQATVLQSAVAVESFIGSDGDLDWYRIDVAQPGAVEITMNSVPAPPLDYDMELYFLQGQSLQFVADSVLPAGDNERIDVTVEGGAATLFLVIFPYTKVPNNFSNSDSYLLRADFPGGATNQPPTITLNSPNGGETFAGGSTQNITWTATDPDTPQNNLLISLEYSSNGGTSFTPVASSVPNTGTFQWSVPSVATTQGRVRATVSDGTASAQDASNGNFTVTTTPVGSHELAIGSGSGTSPQNVTVPLTLDNPVAVGGVQVDVTFDPAIVSFQSATTTVRANGSTVATNVIGGNRLRIVQYFTGGGSIAAGDGAIANVTFQCVAAQNATSPLTLSGAVLSDPDGQPAGDVTTQNGSIDVTGGGGGNQPPTVTVTSPNGGESLAAGSTHNITWTASDPDTPPGSLTVTVAYSTNGGSSFSGVTTTNGTQSNFAWNVPATPTTNAIVSVTVSDGQLQATDSSNAPFQITQIEPGENVLDIGDGSGASGTQVIIPLDLTNAVAVKGLQTDITFDDSVVNFAAATATARATGFTLEAAIQANPEIVRVLLFTTGAGTIAAGSGAIANLTFDLVGAGGTNSPLTPSGTVLSDPDAQPLEVTATGGQISVTGGGGGDPPVLRLFALENPGRTRSLQIFVHSTRPLNQPPTVSAGGTSVAMTAVDPSDHVYAGSIAVGSGASSVAVSASGTGAGGTGTANLTVTF